MFIAFATYMVIYDETTWGLVSGTTAAEMSANGSQATFVMVSQWQDGRWIK